MPYYFSPFRSVYEKDILAEKNNKPEDYCVFCDEDIMHSQSPKNSDDVIYENNYYRWVVNWYPRAEAHTMLLPKRHITNINDETNEELVARQQLLICALDVLTQTFGETGFEIFLQTGLGSMGSKAHLHWHLIPTVIQKDLLGMEKIGYFTATEPEEKKVVLIPTEITIARERLIELIQHKS